jgi:serine peptidase DegS
MKKTADIIGFLVRALIAGLAIAFVIIYLWPSLASRLPADNDGNTNLQGNGQNTFNGPVSYADGVNRTAPSVVSIYTSSLEPQSVTPETQDKLGDRYLYRMRRDMGSGVLVSEDGYILTNHHVISGAQNIKVALWNGRVTGAQVVGSDPQTDLAVLKIDSSGLPTAHINESYKPRVGDVVLAIGNALGLSHTVTMGIVSATDRDNIGSSTYAGFIQTDAAINAGNSGGALINAAGDLIGINTRNLGGIRGAQNIGFAIPMTTAQGIMQQIIENGSVIRGWIGAEFTDIRSKQTREGDANRRGIRVLEVTRGGPAWDAGIRAGDEVIEMNDEDVVDSQSFHFSIASNQPGAKVELEVRRRLEIFQTYAILIQQPPMP